MIIATSRFHICDAGILKIDFKRHKIRPVPLKCFALFPASFIFFNLECASQTLKIVPLKCKTLMRNLLTKNLQYNRLIFRLKKTIQICFLYWRHSLKKETQFLYFSVTTEKQYMCNNSLNRKHCKGFGVFRGTMYLSNFRGKKISKVPLIWQAQS